MQSEGGGGAEKPALPVKRSKSMKVVSKPVSVIPVISVRGEPSFSRDEYSEYRYWSQSTKFLNVSAFLETVLWISASASYNNQEPDSHQSDKLDPDPDQHQFADDKPKCMKDWSLYLEARIWIRNRIHTKVKSRIRIHIGIRIK